MIWQLFGRSLRLAFAFRKTERVLLFALASWSPFLTLLGRALQGCLKKKKASFLIFP